MKKLAILIMAVVMGVTAAAQAPKFSAKPKDNAKVTTTSTIQKVVIQTNGVCQKCENLFKENVPFFKGVKDYTYDSKTSKMTISYDNKKTNPELLRQQISKLGYNADNIKADAAARAKLPACCRVEKKPGQVTGCCGDAAKKGHCSSHDASKCKDKAPVK